MSARRHDLVWLHDRAAPAGSAVIRAWLAAGRPAMVRRRLPGDREDRWPVAIAPRLGFEIEPGAVRSHEPPPLLADALAGRLPGRLPDTLLAVAERAVRLGERFEAPPRLFGSAMWQCVTGLPMTRAGSDLDLLWQAPGDLPGLLAAIAAETPGLDGEVLFAGVGGVNWAELVRARDQDGLLVKDERHVGLITRAAVLEASSRARLAPAEIAAMAHRALIEEIRTFPKPGLVSHVDRGSHADMNAAMLEASADAIRPYLQHLAAAGRAGASMERLRAIGIEAETAMLAATGGVNTHRGAIFGLGLLCAASGWLAGERADGVSLGSLVARCWGDEIAASGTPAGARQEAVSGFASVMAIGLPVLRAARRRSSDDEAARVQCLFALLASVEDTNLVRRGGREGAMFARDAASDFLAAGGVGNDGWRQRAETIHRAFVARRLSPGGCADLLAMTLFVDALETR